MTNEEINKLLAEKVMHYESDSRLSVASNNFWKTFPDQWPDVLVRFEPATDVVQALEVAEKICADLKAPWRMGHYRFSLLEGSTYWFEIGALPGRIFTAASEHMALAICLCCLKVVAPV